MKAANILLVVLLTLSSTVSADDHAAAKPSLPTAPQWQAGTDIEQFWQHYAQSRGGLTWGSSTDYPPYAEVDEGDTLLIQLQQGPCLMEFFHSRWRRANDVRRWDPSVNEYGGCPYVFE